MTAHTLKALCDHLDYQFSNLDLLEEALSHRSFKAAHNERLEFLGDAALNFIITALLYKKFPKAPEGDLSRLRALLVREEALADLAKSFDLTHYLRLGAGELHDGGRDRTSMAADAMEAVMGAIFLDGGIHTLEALVVRWYEPRLVQFKELPELRDAKSLLQEYLQAHKLPLPSYQILKVEGASHQQRFHLECVVKGFKVKTKGVGRTRRQAEQEAAQKFLAEIKKRVD